MTLHIDTRISGTDHEAVPPRIEDVASIFIEEEPAAREYVGYAPPASAAAVKHEATGAADLDGEINIFGAQAGLRNKLSAYGARRRLNRTFRRNQREFDKAMSAVAHDPASQRELQASWTLGR